MRRRTLPVQPAPEQSRLAERREEHLRAARFLVSKGRWDAARDALLRVIDKFGEDAELLVELGNVYSSLGDDLAAAQSYRRAEELGAPPEVALAYARALLKAGRKDEAIGYLRAKVQGVEDLPLKLAILDELTFSDSEDTELLASKARVLEQMGAQSLAAIAYLDLAEKLMLRNRLEEAAEACERATHLDPDNEDAARLMGILKESSDPATRYTLEEAERLKEANDLEGAVQAYSRAIDIGLGSPEVHYALALVLIELGRWADAAPHLEMAAKDASLFVSAQFSLGQCYEQSGDLTTAAERYLEAVEAVDTGSLLPSDLPEYWELASAAARSLRAVGRSAEALAVVRRFQAAAQSVPGGATYAQQAAELLGQDGAASSADPPRETVVRPWDALPGSPELGARAADAEAGESPKGELHEMGAGEPIQPLAEAEPVPDAASEGVGTSPEVAEHQRQDTFSGPSAAVGASTERYPIDLGTSSGVPPEIRGPEKRASGGTRPSEVLGMGAGGAESEPVGEPGDPSKSSNLPSGKTGGGALVAEEPLSAGLEPEHLAPGAAPAHGDVTSERTGGAVSWGMHVAGPDRSPDLPVHGADSEGMGYPGHVVAEGDLAVSEPGSFEAELTEATDAYASGEPRSFGFDGEVERPEPEVSEHSQENAVSAWPGGGVVENGQEVQLEEKTVVPDSPATRAADGDVQDHIEVVSPPLHGPELGKAGDTEVEDRAETAQESGGAPGWNSWLVPRMMDQRSAMEAANPESTDEMEPMQTFGLAPQGQGAQLGPGLLASGDAGLTASPPGSVGSGPEPEHDLPHAEAGSRPGTSKDMILNGNDVPRPASSGDGYTAMGGTQRFAEGPAEGLTPSPAGLSGAADGAQYKVEAGRDAPAASQLEPPGFAGSLASYTGWDRPWSVIEGALGSYTSDPVRRLANSCIGWAYLGSARNFLAAWHLLEALWKVGGDPRPTVYVLARLVCMPNPLELGQLDWLRPMQAAAESYGPFEDLAVGAVGLAARGFDVREVLGLAVKHHGRSALHTWMEVGVDLAVAAPQSAVLSRLRSSKAADLALLEGALSSGTYPGEPPQAAIESCLVLLWAARQCRPMGWLGLLLRRLGDEAAARRAFGLADLLCDSGMPLWRELAAMDEGQPLPAHLLDDHRPELPVWMVNSEEDNGKLIASQVEQLAYLLAGAARASPRLAAIIAPVRKAVEGNDWPLAVSRLAHIVQKLPSVPVFRKMLALAMIRAGMYDDAVRVLVELAEALGAERPGEARKELLLAAALAGSLGLRARQVLLLESAKKLAT